MNPKYYYIDGIGNGYLAIFNSIRIENMAVWDWNPDSNPVVP